MERTFWNGVVIAVTLLVVTAPVGSAMSGALATQNPNVGSSTQSLADVVYDLLSVFADGGDDSKNGDGSGGKDSGGKQGAGDPGSGNEGNGNGNESGNKSTGSSNGGGQNHQTETTTDVSPGQATTEETTPTSSETTRKTTGQRGGDGDDGRQTQNGKSEQSDRSEGMEGQTTTSQNDDGQASDGSKDRDTEGQTSNGPQNGDDTGQASDDSEKGEDRGTDQNRTGRDPGAGGQNDDERTAQKRDGETPSGPSVGGLASSPQLKGAPSGDSGGPGGPGSFDELNRSIELGPNATALDHRRAALKLLADASLNPGNGDSSGLKEQLLADLDDSQATHLDANRTRTAELFRTDKRVTAPLANRVPNVTVHVLAADAILAQTAIGDAERVRAILDERGVEFDEAAVSENITAAKNAYQQGEFVRENSRAAAIEHYRQAWTHAQRALDVMDEATEPNVTVDTRQDVPRRNASTHAVNGTVFDVRPYELNATVTYPNGTREVSLTTSTTPGTVATFNASVRLDSLMPNDTAVQRINLSAFDPGTDVADQGYDEEDHWNVHQTQTGTDVVRLDGDGLPDTYEERVTGTDPADTDSDSAATDADEADDGHLDGAEDLDADGAILYQEYRLGLGPFDPDTDDDNLTDGFELHYADLDPTTNDTDDDGTFDGLEDFDDDNLTNTQEEAAGTVPVKNDTDGDGLFDGAEVNEYGTAPTKVDTDNDTLSDADELDLPTDPTDPDTDGDGTPDGEETFTTETTDEETGVAVSMTGEGNVAAAVSVENVSTDATGEARRSHVMHLTSEREFDNATVSLPVGESADLDENLTVVKWDPVDNESIHPVATDLDRKNRTATTTVSGFSYFMVVEYDEWQSMRTATVTLDWPVHESFDDLRGWTGDGTAEDGTLVVSHESSGGGGGGGGGGGECEDMTSRNQDCDGDGLSNLAELKYLPTIPVDSDTDGDGLDDGSEVNGDTDAADPDTDGDGYDDGSDPYPLDSSRPNECSDFLSSNQDCDGDGLSNLREFKYMDTDARDPDTDGDGFDDASDPAPTNSNVPDFGSLSVETTDTEQSMAKRSLSLDGAEEITFEIEVKGEAADSDSTGKVVVAGEGDSKTVFSVTDGSQGWTTKEVDLTRFAGEEVTVKVIASGDATVKVDSISVTQDIDGDGFSDTVEDTASGLVAPEEFAYAMSTGSYTTYRKLELDARFADTDSDGLTDDEEVDLNWERNGDTMMVKVVSASSHPSVDDTDGDTLGDDEEQRVNTDPYNIDTDNDGFLDHVDERPKTEDRPPEVNVKLATFNQVEVHASDEGSGLKSKSVVVDAHYPSVLGDGSWKSYEPSLVWLTTEPKKYWFDIERKGVLDKAPDKYRITVTDKNGNAVSYEVTGSEFDTPRIGHVESSRAKKAAETAWDFITDEISSPPAPNDPGFGTLLNLVESLGDFDIDGDGVVAYEELDDPWECGGFDCEDDNPGWDGPDLSTGECGEDYVCA